MPKAKAYEEVKVSAALSLLYLHREKLIASLLKCDSVENAIRDLSSVANINALIEQCEDLEPQINSVQPDPEPEV